MSEYKVDEIYASENDSIVIQMPIYEGLYCTGTFTTKGPLQVTVRIKESLERYVPFTARFTGKRKADLMSLEEANT